MWSWNTRCGCDIFRLAMQERSATRFIVDSPTPAYLAPEVRSTLSERVEQAAAELESCRACPRNCRVDRTADEEKGLGTGETDYTAQVDVFQPVGEGHILFLTAGYRWRGSPDAYELNDGMIGSVGASFKVSDQTSAGLVFDWREAATETGDDPMQLTPFISWKAADDWGVQLYGSAGFSDAKLVPCASAIIPGKCEAG